MREVGWRNMDNRQLHPLKPPCHASLRLSACLRSLSALVAASRKEDRYGVVLLCDPNLADVLTTLASAVLALQQYTRILVGFLNHL